MGGPTVIRDAAWVIAWDRAEARHVYLRDADVAFESDTITFVGRAYEGAADAEIDGRERLVMPGLVNIHSHPASEPLRKGITDETRSHGFWHTSLYEYLTVFDTDEDGFAACLQVGLSELLLSGVTTLVDIWLPFDGWLDRLAESGMRAWAAPMYREARWFTRDGHSVEYEWDANAGRKAFERACQTIELARQHPSGRLGGMLAPAQVDTCSAALIRDSVAYAEEKDLRLQIHAAQSVVEFHEMTRRHGLTPVQWLDDIGALGERTIVGHGVFLDHHPWLHWTTRRDLGLLADNGVTVAHCPTVFLRRGIALRSFGDYVRAGVTMGIGTDTYPHNYLEEMRSVATTARIIAETVDDLETSDVFNAATAGGARALGRDDIGGIAPGFKADLVLVDLKHPAMMPVREPLRSLIHVAGERAVRDVYVDGKQVVRGGKVLTIDHRAACEALEEAQRRALTAVPDLDWAGRDADTLAPMALPTAEKI